MSEKMLGERADDTGLIPLLSPPGDVGGETYVVLPVVDAFRPGQFVAVYSDGSYVRDWVPSS